MRRFRLTGLEVAASLRNRIVRMPLVHRNNFEASNISRRFKGLMTRLAPYAAAASSALILWHAARDTPASAAFVPAPLIYPHAPAGGAAPAPQAKQVQGGGPPSVATVQGDPPSIAQQANVA